MVISRPFIRLLWNL